MIRITKSERDLLVKMGCADYEPRDSFKDICKTYGHHTSYYLRESAKNLELLERIRGTKG